MSLQVADYVFQFRDSKIERQLAAQLRKEPEEDRLRFIQELLGSGYRHSFAVALWLVRTCLRDRKSFETILNQGLDHSDASVIKLWLESVMNGLGFRRVVAILAQRLPQAPRSVIHARYWLPTWLPCGNKSAEAALTSLNQQIEEAIKEDPSLEQLVKPIRNLE